MDQQFKPKRVFSDGVTIVVGLILIACQLLIVPLLIPIFVYRWFLGKTSYFLNPSLGEMVNSRGHFFAAENFTCGKSSRAVIVFTATLEGHLSLEEAQKTIYNNLLNATDGGRLKYPEFQQYITTWPFVIGFSFWKPENNFNICQHVMKFQPTKNVTDSQLEAFMETLLNQPFQPEKSPWQVYIANNYVNSEISSENMTLVIVKTHHALSDGYGLLYTVMDTLGGKNKIPSVPKPDYHTRKNSWDRLKFFMTFPLQSIYELSKFVVLTFHTHPWKIPDAKKSWKQLYCKTPIIPVDKIKAIKTKFGVSFTSVVLSAYAGASQKVLRKLGEKQGKTTGDSLPCALILPLPDHPKILRNHCTGAYISLPMVECGPVERLLECEEQVHGAKRSVLPIFGRFFPVYGGSFPTSLARHIVKNRQFPVGISNFPVGERKFKLFDRNMLHITMGAGPQAGMAGLCFFVYTYDTGIQFTVTVEGALMSQQELKCMMQYIVEEIDHLHSMNVV